MLTNERILVLQDGEEAHVKRVSSRGGDRVATITNLFFKNKHLSKQHATVRYDKNDGYTIEDTNSTFGTIINDSVIKHNVRHQLKNKDTLGFILSKPSSKIKEVFKAFDSDWEHKSIPLAEFDSPKVSMQFEVVINNSVLKLVPSSSEETGRGSDFTIEDSVTNISTFDNTESAVNDAESGEKSDDEDCNEAQEKKKKTKKLASIVIDLDKENESDKLLTKDEDEPLPTFQESSLSEPTEGSKEENALQTMENQNGSYHCQNKDDTLKKDNLREGSKEYISLVSNDDDALEEDGPPSESDIVYEGSDVESEYSEKDNHDKREGVANTDNTMPDDKHVMVDSALRHSDNLVSKSPSSIEVSDKEHDPYDLAHFVDHDDVECDESDGNSSDADVVDGVGKSGCDFDDAISQSDSNHSHWSSDWEENSQSLDFDLQVIDSEEESICVCSDLEGCYCGKKQWLNLGICDKDKVGHSDGRSSTSLKYAECNCDTCDYLEKSGVDFVNLCVCSDPEDCYCDKPQLDPLVMKKAREYAERVAAGSEYGDKSKDRAVVANGLFTKAEVASSSRKRNEVLTKEGLPSSRKRSHDEMSEGEEEDNPGSGSSNGNEDKVAMPPRKRSASENSKLKGIVKEVAKGLFYVGATITALGIYGATLEEE
ncbi:m [Candida theae]|uniref:M n=1 Tax=Candida theae TaxID=1198502 RepID=A0AAD5FXH8_9ASCO|nr:m [Candida theae] [Candida theae]KAI5954779.1 m [Candida theae] [Candida theae]